ncbi:MAG: ABC transporter permease [Myxococcota bacterium]
MNDAGVSTKVLTPFSQLGATLIDGLEEIGRVLQFMVQVIKTAIKPPYRVNLILTQCEFVGVGSLFIILLTGTFTGAVFTLQSVDAFAQVGMETMVGSTVLVAVARELGPVLTALMVTGRVASAMATELGTMRVSEQIDAMEVMAVNPLKYLVVPRIVATTAMTPVLTVIFTMVSTVGSYIVAVVFGGIDEGTFIYRIQWLLDPFDFTHGLYKAAVFGFLIAAIGCYKGYHAHGGARGVGVATTQAVVIGSITIFVVDYLLTSILLQMEPGYFDIGAGSG